MIISFEQFLQSFHDWVKIFAFLWTIFLPFFRVHYTEYLCGLVFRNNVDPVSLLDLGELKQVFARANHFMPRQRPGEYEFQYKKRLAQVIHFISKKSGRTVKCSEYLYSA